MLPDQTEILRRLLLAAFFGVLFGIERRHRKKPIGARTNVLIAIAAATLSIISAYGFTEAAELANSYYNFRSDPARLMVGMLTGIGFIGAGIIYKGPHGDVKGITTAAEVYLMAVIGIGAGLGLFRLVITTGLIGYIVLFCSEETMSGIREKMRSLRMPKDKEE
ncbi:MAG: MgtC/SapB family protein [Synergistes sp.]|nr:MgtC/SapB family protein [Synergistes sp.]